MKSHKQTNQNNYIHIRNCNGPLWAYKSNLTLSNSNQSIITYPQLQKSHTDTFETKYKRIRNSISTNLVVLQMRYDLPFNTNYYLITQHYKIEANEVNLPNPNENFNDRIITNLEKIGKLRKLYLCEIYCYTLNYEFVYSYDILEGTYHVSKHTGPYLVYDLIFLNTL